MDGKSRWANNIIIERWFRGFGVSWYANLKNEAIGRSIYNYNFERCHQAIDNKRPAEVYYPAMLLDEARQPHDIKKSGRRFIAFSCSVASYQFLPQKYVYDN